MSLICSSRLFLARLTQIDIYCSSEKLDFFFTMKLLY